MDCKFGYFTGTNELKKIGLEAALDLTYYLTVDYTPSVFYDELRGISDGLFYLQLKLMCSIWCGLQHSS